MTKRLKLRKNSPRKEDDDDNSNNSPHYLLSNNFMGLMTDTNSITSKNTISNKEQVSHPDHVALIKEPTTSKNYNTETEYDDDYDDDFDFAQLRLSTEKIHRDYDPKTIVNDSEYPQFNENAFFKQFLDPSLKQGAGVRRDYPASASGR
jgi:hypothetical protein